MSFGDLDRLSAVLHSNLFGPIPGIVASLCLKAFKDGFIYMPKVSPYSTKELKKLGLSEIKVKTKDRVRIKTALHVCSENPDAPVLIGFHGNGSNLLNLMSRMKDMAEEINFHYFGVSYRAYSGARGYPYKAGIELDALAAMDYLKNEILGKKLNKDCPVFVQGSSLGAAVACFLASREEYQDIVKGVVIDGPFSSVENFMKNQAPFLGEVSGVVADGENWNNLEYFESIKAPILMVGAINDEICHFWHFEMLVEKAKTLGLDHTTLVFEEGGHNDSLCIEKNYSEYLKVLVKFLADKS